MSTSNVKLSIIFLVLLFPLIGISQTLYMDSVILFSQGLTNEGAYVLSERSNPNKSLGEPQKSDIESGNPNFFSLGFGGYITLKNNSGVIVNPLTYIEIFETTYSYQCNQYPEKANIYASKNGHDFILIGETCGNNNTIFSLYGIIDTLNYIKIEDRSNVSKFTKFHGCDGYDVDGIEIYNLNPLSIEIDFFNAKIIGDRLFVKFRTLSESGTMKFNIQASDNSIDFKDLEISFPGANYSSLPRYYEGSILYDQKGEIGYIRLKEIDLNGEVFYFDAVPVTKEIEIKTGSFYDILGRRTNEGIFLIRY